MKILHVGKYFSPFRGGLENYMHDLMAAHCRRGIGHAAIVHSHERSFRSTEEIFETGQARFRIVRAGTWLRLFFTPISPAFPVEFRRMMKAFRPDILHLHMPNPSVFWCLLLPSARRLPWVVHWHSDVITQAQGWPMRFFHAFYRPLERSVLKRADAIIVTSPPYLDSSQPLRTWREKCHVVPLGMDPGRLTGVVMGGSVEAPAKSTGSRPLRVLAVGRLSYYKGFDFLVEAVARVENVTLDIVGEGEQADSLKSRVTSLGIEDRVTFRGAASDAELGSLMARCDCLCLPSIERTEAFGVALLEAMSFGKAVVASDVPGSGMGWIVEQGVTGLKVRPANVGALASVLGQMERDRKQTAEMGMRGKEKFDRMFQIDHAAEGVLNVYQQVLSQRPAPPIRDDAR